MMIDGKGCALLIGIIAAIGFVIGLIASWLGAPSWAPAAGAVGLPAAVAIYFFGSIALDQFTGRLK